VVPVHKYGVSLATGGVPGWQAFRLALSPIWRLDNVQADSALAAVVATVSGLTNLLVPVAVVALLRVPRGTRTPRLLGWLLLGAAALNSTWFVLGADRWELRIGYYLWVFSFLVLGIAALRHPCGHGSSDRPRNES
jgi:hypothetical protein